MSWFNAKRQKDSKEASVRIYDQIGESWFGESTSAKGFTKAVDELGEDLERLNIYINSPGGNVYDGLAIYNYLKRHKAEVVVHVDGIAASIASIIAMAGDKIVMPENANMFIHNPWTFAGGDAASLRKTADELDAMRGSLLGIYMSRVNLEEQDVIDMMDSETLLTAEEAVAWGFATEMAEASQMAASMNPEEIMNRALANAGSEVKIANLEARVASLKELRDEMELKAELLGEELVEAQAKLLEYEDMMEGMYAPEPAMLAEDVIDLVMLAGAPEWLATQCISEGFGETDVADRIENYQAIFDACVAAGLKDAEAICREHLGNPAKLVSALLVEALAEAEEETKNRRVFGNEDKLVRIDYQQAYAQRRPKTH